MVEISQDFVFDENKYIRQSSYFAFVLFSFISLLYFTHPIAYSLFRYLEETANSPFNNIRSSHNIGRLGNLVQACIVQSFLYSSSRLFCLWRRVINIFLFWDEFFPVFLFQESDEFYDLISSKFLTESVYSLSIRAAAARLLISCSSCWMVSLLFFFVKLICLSQIELGQPCLLYFELLFYESSIHMFLRMQCLTMSKVGSLWIW